MSGVSQEEVEWRLDGGMEKEGRAGRCCSFIMYVGGRRSVEESEEQVVGSWVGRRSWQSYPTDGQGRLSQRGGEGLSLNEPPTSLHYASPRLPHPLPLPLPTPLPCPFPAFPSLLLPFPHYAQTVSLCSHTSFP